jgi:hypothetical protein
VTCHLQASSRCETVDTRARDQNLVGLRHGALSVSPAKEIGHRPSEQLTGGALRQRRPR